MSDSGTETQDPMVILETQMVELQTTIKRLEAELEEKKTEYTKLVDGPTDPKYVNGGCIIVAGKGFTITAPVVAELLAGAPTQVRDYFTETKVSVTGDKIEKMAKAADDTVRSWFPLLQEKLISAKKKAFAKLKKKGDGSHLVIRVEGRKS